MANLPGAVQGARIVGERFAQTRRWQNPDGRMPLMEHLRELRNRLVKSVLVIIVGMIVALVFSSQTLNLIARPFCSAVIDGMSGCHQVGDKLVINGVFDGFILRIKIAFLFALIGTCPVWLYQLWAFIAPGLCAREKKWAYLFTFTAVPLFVGGAVLAYVVMDRGLHYLLNLTPQNSLVLPSWDTYLSYFTGMLVGFGIVFELPLVIVMLNMAGILTHERFRKSRRVLIFCIFLIAGIEPEPGPVDDAHPRRARGRAGRGGRVHRVANDRRKARLHPDPYTGLADDDLAPLPFGGGGRG